MVPRFGNNNNIQDANKKKSSITKKQDFEYAANPSKYSSWFSFGNKNNNKKRNRRKQNTAETQDEWFSASLSGFDNMLHASHGATGAAGGLLKYRTQKESLEWAYGTQLDDANNAAPKEKTVTFTTATVYYHNTVLGDNPFVSCGAPLSLGWTLVAQEEIPDVTQVPNPSGVSQWQGKNRLVIPEDVRKRQLLEAGEDPEEIRCVACCLQKQRKQLSLPNEQYAWLDNALSKGARRTYLG